MALLVLCDPTFRNSAWCEKKIKGIRDEAARRRTAVKVYTNTSVFESAAAKLDENSSVIVLFSKISYIQSIADLLSRLPVHPILANSTLDITLPFAYSSVVTDVEADVRIALEYLYSCDKRKIALLGVDRNSWGDMGMAEAFLRYAPDLAESVFYAQGDMEGCFFAYLSVIENSDAVIMPNDHLAICFIEFLKKQGAYRKDLFIIGKGDSISARLYGEGLTSITTDFYKGGRALAELHFNRLKYGWKSANIKLESQLVVRGSTKNIPFASPRVCLRPSDISEAVTPTLLTIPTNPIGRVDSLLSSGDLSAFRLIYGMLCGYSYEKIGEFCFLSVETVKYRVRKICSALGENKKADAAALLSKYVSKEKLLQIIEELENEKCIK